MPISKEFSRCIRAILDQMNLANQPPITASGREEDMGNLSQAADLITFQDRTSRVSMDNQATHLRNPPIPAGRGSGVHARTILQSINQLRSLRSLVLTEKLADPVEVAGDVAACSAV